LTKLQKAGRTFLLRLVAEYGPPGARVLRAFEKVPPRFQRGSVLSVTMTEM